MKKEYLKPVVTTYTFQIHQTLLAGSAGMVTGTSMDFGSDAGDGDEADARALEIWEDEDQEEFL